MLTRIGFPPDGRNNGIRLRGADHPDIARGGVARHEVVGLPPRVDILVARTDPAGPKSPGFRASRRAGSRADRRTCGFIAFFMATAAGQPGILGSWLQSHAGVWVPGGAPVSCRFWLDHDKAQTAVHAVGGYTPASRWQRPAIGAAGIDGYEWRMAERFGPDGGTCALSLADVLCSVVMERQWAASLHHRRRSSGLCRNLFNWC